MADLVWPADLAPTTGGLPMPNFANVTGPATTAGQTQAVATDAGFWTLKMGAVPVHSTHQWRAWQATQFGLNGRVKTCLVPIWSKITAPWPSIWGRRVRRGAGITPGGVLIWVQLEGALAAGAVAAQLRLKRGEPLAAGMHFSVAERLFGIQSVSAVTKDGDDRLFQVILWPPAREAVGAGAQLEFDSPMFRCRLASDAEMNIDQDLSGTGSADVNWIEDV